MYGHLHASATLLPAKDEPQCLLKPEAVVKSKSLPLPRLHPSPYSVNLKPFVSQFNLSGMCFAFRGPYDWCAEWLSLCILTADVSGLVGSKWISNERVGINGVLLTRVLDTTEPPISCQQIQSFSTRLNIQSHVCTRENSYGHTAWLNVNLLWSVFFPLCMVQGKYPVQ
jgi:hypothetical protein